MRKMIAFCGITCTECPAFLATQQNDDEARHKVAETWSADYDADIRPEDINCEGCLSKTRRVFRYCTVCEIRKCGQDKNVINCAYCDDYVCETLKAFLEQAPNAQENLEQIRKNLYTL
jgi:hypothetical protein